MSNVSGGRTGSADPHPRLGAAALAAVIIGVLLLAAAAFVLSYAGIHQIALAAGVSAKLARAYPVIFDAMLVIAFAAALALRGAGWWTRLYVWLSLLILLAAVAAGDAVHAMGIKLPARPSAAAAAIIPWVLLLLAFGLWLAMLRYVRRLRSARGGGKRAGAWDATRPDRDSLVELRPAAAAPGLEASGVPGPLPQRSGLGQVPPPQRAPGAGAGRHPGPGGAQFPEAQPPAVAARFDRMRSTPLAPVGEARDDEAPAGDNASVSAGGKAPAGDKPSAGDTAPAGGTAPAGSMAPAGDRAGAAGECTRDGNVGKPGGPAGHETDGGHAGTAAAGPGSGGADARPGERPGPSVPGPPAPGPGTPGPGTPEHEGPFGLGPG